MTLMPRVVSTGCCNDQTGGWATPWVLPNRVRVSVELVLDGAAARIAAAT
jgi:hypothetical protein